MKQMKTQKRKWGVLTMVALMASLVSIGGTAQAALVNGDFETGDFTGFTASPAPNGFVTIQTDGNTSSLFANLTGGEANIYSTLTSNLFTAGSGDILSFEAFFSTSDYLPYNDDAYVNLIDTLTSTATPLFTSSVAALGNTQENTSSTPWTSVSYTFTNSGSYQVQAGVRNVLDSGVASTLGVDNFALNTAPVPEPGTMSLMGLGLASLAAARRRKKQKEDAGYDRLSKELQDVA